MIVKIKLFNPYYEDVAIYKGTKEQLKQTLLNIEHGNQDFIFCETEEGNLCTISPKNFAKIEVEE